MLSHRPIFHTVPRNKYKQKRSQKHLTGGKRRKIQRENKKRKKQPTSTPRNDNERTKRKTKTISKDTNSIRIYGTNGIKSLFVFRNICLRNGIPINFYTIHSFKHKGYKSNNFDSRHIDIVFKSST